MSLFQDNQLERYYAKDRAGWRAWLENNHATSSRVWLVYYKQSSGKPCVSYEDAVEEALCFGWIDSRTNPLDGESYMQMFSHRRPRSPWSKPNKERIEKLTRLGLLTTAGLQVVETAKQDGSWSAYDMIEALIIPEDLATVLAANFAAQTHFEAFSNSSKKQLLWHIESAKRPETRAKRIEQIVSAAAQNTNPLNYAANKRKS